MSSLYKNGYVKSNDAGFRIINSNSAIEEKMLSYIATNNVKQTMKNSGDDGFEIENEDSEFASLEEITETINPEELIANARAEAAAIIEEANTKADSMIRQAIEQSESLKQSAMEDGRQSGYADGQKEANVQLETQLQQLEQEKTSMAQDYQNRYEHMEEELVDVVLDVFESAFCIEFSEQKELLIHLVKDTIDGIDSAKKFEVKVAPDRVEELEKHKMSLADKVGSTVTIEILADGHLTGNDCVIETENGIYECGPLIQMKNLTDRIRMISKQ